jgi:hypothetical protein
MTQIALNPAPSLETVAGEQFRSVGLSLRREGLVAAGFLGLASIWVGYLEVYSSYFHVGLTPQAGVPVALVALLLPMAVWKGEHPARRGYHRAMPVPHGAHAVARSLAGLAWLLPALGAYFGWVALASALTGGSTEAVDGWRWATPFVGAAVLYLFGSALALVTAYPWRWMGGAAVGYMFLASLRSADDDSALFTALHGVLYGRFGVLTVVAGRFETTLGYGARPAGFGVWMVATWIWLAIAITVFLWAAYRQPES